MSWFVRREYISKVPLRFRLGHHVDNNKGKGKGKEYGGVWQSEVVRATRSQVFILEGSAVIN